MDAYEVSLRVAFQPALTIAKQQRAMECLEAVVVPAPDSEAARNDAEFAVARALSTAGHTMITAPIKTESVRLTSNG